VDAEAKERLNANPVFRVVRWTVPWIALGLIVYSLWSLYGAFTVESRAWESQSAEPTGTLGSVVATMQAQATTLIDGLNMRDRPDTGGTVLAKLPKGATLVVLELRDGWYRAKAPTGTEGWVSANAQYVQIVKK
jgi:hypothetical protein